MKQKTKPVLLPSPPHGEAPGRSSFPAGPVFPKAFRRCSFTLFLAAALCITLQGTRTAHGFYTAASFRSESPVAAGLCTIALESSGSLPAKPSGGAASAGTCRLAVRNTGDTSCYVRLRLVCSTESLAEHLVPGGSGTSSWVSGLSNEADGYYYYPLPLEPGEATPAFCERLTVSAGLSEDALRNYAIRPYAEAVQQGDNTDYTAAWEGFLS